MHTKANDQMWAFMGRWASTNHVDLRDKQGLKQAEQAWDDHLEAQCSCSDPVEVEPKEVVTNCPICGTMTIASSHNLCTTCQILYPDAI